MEPLHVVCSQRDTVNRVPHAKLTAGGSCGECHRPLFDGYPVALDAARFEKHFVKSDLPLLVDFWATWCGPCRGMAPEFARAAARLEPRMRLVKVDVDAVPTIAERFGIHGIPTVALTLHGREVARHVGAVSADQLERWVLGHVPADRRAG